MVCPLDSIEIGSGRRHRELTDNKNNKGKIHLRILFKYNFEFAGSQEKGIFGLSYGLTLTRKSDNSVLNKDNPINDAKIKTNAIEWYLPHYTPSIPQQAILSKKILSKTPTELNM